MFDSDKVAALSAAIQVNRDAIIAKREAQKKAEEEAENARIAEEQAAKEA